MKLVIYVRTWRVAKQSQQINWLVIGMEMTKCCVDPRLAHWAISHSSQWFHNQCSKKRLGEFLQNEINVKLMGLLMG